MKVERQHIIIGGLAILSVAAAAAYWQYTKLMNYVIGFKGIKVKEASVTKLNFEVSLNFTNNSDIKFELVEQEYKVYMNDAFITKLESKNTSVILPKTTSVISVDVTLNPKQVIKVLNKNWFDLLASRDKVMVKLDMKLKVKLWFFTIPIPFVYIAPLKDFTTV